MIQDVTEREEGRRQLERQKEYTDRLLNASDDLFFVLGKNAQFQRWNDRFPEVTGYSGAEIGEMSAVDLVPEEEREQVAAEITEALATGRGQVEVPLLRKDETTVPYEFVGNRVEHSEGGLRVVVVGRDVSERKARERRLRRAETMFQNAQDPLFLIDVENKGENGEEEPSFTVRRVNPAYERKTGLSEEDIRGQTPQEIIGGDAGRYMEEQYRTCFRQRESLEYNEEARLDGAMTYWTTRIAPVVVEGKVEQIVGTTRDVTEQQRRKQRLERQNDLFERAQQIADVGAWEYDVRADEHRWTDQVHRIYGREGAGGPAPSVDSGIESYHPEDRPAVRKAFGEAVQEGTPYDIEVRLITDGGEERWVRTRGEPQRENVNPEGEVVRVRGTIRDITERKEREQALREAKEEAEAANRMKSVFLANMSHEIRTPLTSILGFAEMIGEEVRNAEDRSAVDLSTLQEFASLIEKSGERLMDTLTGVLNLSKLEAGEMDLSVGPVDLPAEAAQVAEELRPQAEEKGLDFQVESGDAPARAWADAGGVQIVLRNLVSNAIKYTESGGEVQVRIYQEEGEAVLEVDDSGIGMDPGRLETLFEPFRQASEGVSRAYEGTGLGLALTRKTTRQMGGRLEVETEKGEGTCMTACFPQAKDRLPQAKNGEAKDEEGG
jgi:PAS domain S-box-containing protein